MNVARPLEELIPRDTKPEHYHLAIDAAINELIPLIHRDLTIAGVSTEFEFTGNPEWDPERKRVVHGKRYLDVIDNYFEIPHPSTASSFNVVLSVIQRGVGVYEARKRRAFWENLNPLRWLAGLLRVPIFVLEEAGYLTPQSKPWVLSVLKIAFPIALAVAVLVLVKFFGIKLPPELLKHLKIEP